MIRALLIGLMLAGNAHAVTIRQMIDDDRYWPKPCSRTVCILTGLGGMVDVWERHIDAHRGRLFIVRGLCASACEIAVRRAQHGGERVSYSRGARLIRHTPSKAIWRTTGRPDG